MVIGRWNLIHSGPGEPTDTNSNTPISCIDNCNMYTERENFHRALAHEMKTIMTGVVAQSLHNWYKLVYHNPRGLYILLQGHFDIYVYCFSFHSSKAMKSA